MSEFVTKVLSWCDGLVDERLARLRADWAAITNADADEQAFCQAAGRMGLDPYAVHDWHHGLVDLLTTGLGAKLDVPLVDDLLQSAEPESVSALWQWVSDAEQSFRFAAGAIGSVQSGSNARRAKDQGYFVARQVRSLAGLAADAPIDDLASFAQKIDGVSLSFADYNHRPSNAVHAAVGWRGGREAVIVGPQPKYPVNERFLLARGLYLVMLGCRQGARLLTRAHTWDQQASRAFAAELLAPQEALVKHAKPEMELDERRQLQEELGARFQVSAEAIRLQLENEGVWAAEF
jgi:hypothetical protein